MATVPGGATAKLLACLDKSKHGRGMADRRWRAAAALLGGAESGILLVTCNRFLIKKCKISLQISEKYAKIYLPKRNRGGSMRRSSNLESGRADPLGLLILTVVLALTVTMGIQAQVGAQGGAAGALPADCHAPCVTLEMRH